MMVNQDLAWRRDSNYSCAWRLTYRALLPGVDAGGVGPAGGDCTATLLVESGVCGVCGVPVEELDDTDDLDLEDVDLS